MEEDQLRQRRLNTKLAIDLAMQGKWQEAVEANQNIISSFPDDVEALNRMGRAFLEQGEFARAREFYRKAVEFDPYNAIARKNLQRLSRLDDNAAVEADTTTARPDHFIEEVGKAGIVRLNHPAAPEVLAKMVAGDKVYLEIDGSRLVVKNGRSEYLGEIGPRHAIRLIKLILGGNRYSAAVVNAAENNLTVIIRETYQHPSQVGQPSFPPKGFEEPRTYVGDRILKRELEYASQEGPGYTIVDEEGMEVPLKEPLEGEEEEESEEEE